MNWIHRRLAVLRSRSARKLLVVSVALTLLIAFVAFVGTFLISVINEVILLQSYINTLPILVEERMGEMDRVDRAYMDDYVACGDIARTMYDRYDTLEPNRRLELACRHAGAVNVTLLDGGGHFIASATGERPSRAVSAAYEAADQNESELFDPNMAGVNMKVVNSEDFDPETDSMPMVYWSELADGSFLMVEMDYTPYGQVLNDLFTWDSVFERAMTGLDGFGFLRFEDGALYGYPLEDLTGEQARVLQEQALAVFDGLEDSPLKLSVYEGNEVHFSVTNLLGEPHLVVGTPTDASGLTYMLAVPVGSFAGFMLLCDLSVVVLVVVGFVLFSRYATQSFRRNAIETTDARLRARTARVRAFPGIAVVLVVTGALSAMLFMLEGLSNTARNTTTQHETINWEADYLTRRKNAVEREYTSRFRQRSTAMARLLSDFPELRTQERLREFNELCRSEHLMLFDQEGNELFDSHDFTGFSVDDETYGRPEWRAVLKGYIQVETPSAVNPSPGSTSAR